MAQATPRRGWLNHPGTSSPSDSKILSQHHRPSTFFDQNLGTCNVPFLNQCPHLPAVSPEPLGLPGQHCRCALRSNILQEKILLLKKRKKKYMNTCQEWLFIQVPTAGHVKSWWASETPVIAKWRCSRPHSRPRTSPRVDRSL